MRTEIKTLQKIFWSSIPTNQIDVIILFGATRSDWSDIVKKIHGLDYKFLLITGKWSAWNKEKNIISQAEFIWQQCINQSIPMKKIILEKKSMNTLENVIFSFDLLRKKKISPKSICFVSKSHHALRCLLTLKKYFWDITYSCLTYDMEKETLTVKRTDWMKYGLTYDIVKKEYDKIFRYVSRGDIESPAGLIK
jgi:uncharacterized SAM-binding protein YcdF (DUF218 family)